MGLNRENPDVFDDYGLKVSAARSGNGGAMLLVGLIRRASLLLHFQNSVGRRITVAAGESYNAKRDEDLEEALGRWLEE